MSAVKKSYLLAPNFTFPRDGPIKLGSIIADPFAPDLVLTTMSAAAKPTIYTASESLLSFIHNKGRTGTFGAWIDFLEVASTKFDVSASHETGSRYRMTDMETSYYYPTDEEIAERVKDKKVQKTMELGLLGSPVYIITGLKVATGFGANSIEASTTTISDEAGADPGKAAGVLPAKVGAHGSLSILDSEKISFKSKNDIVFAYQLWQIERRIMSTTVKSSEFLPKAAFLNKNGSEVVEEESVEFDICDVQEEQLLKIEDLAIEKHEVQGETRTCTYISETRK